MNKTILKKAVSAIMALSISAVSFTAAALENTVTMQIDNPTMTVNGVEQKIDEDGTAPIIENDRTMLPIRAIIEALGGEVEWDEATQTITIKQSTEKEDTSLNPNTAVRVSPEDEYYIFELSDKVTREHVYYKNRYGIEIAGDLYIPKDIDETKKYPAVVIGPPYGGVKQQGPGVYANELAQRGFIALAYDPSYNGESGGEPRHLSSPEIFSEDFSAGVDFLGTRDFVDREKIGVIGICGSGGFALSAAAMDTRIKAVVTSAMYDISSMGNSMDNESRNGMINNLAAQRWTDFENGEPSYSRNYPADAPLEAIPEGTTGTNIEWWTFYGLKRGWHPNAGGSFTGTSMLPFANYSLLNHIDGISPRPILFITGDIAHSKAFSETAYNAASEPKELYVVPGAMHIDLYDDVTKIPFDKIESFLNDSFNK